MWFGQFGDYNRFNLSGLLSQSVKQFAARGRPAAVEAVNPGANGSFVLYEDENDSYDYEKGLHDTIPFTWNDISRTLTIGKRVGDFPGMRKDRTFKVVLVRPDHGTGLDMTLQPDQIVSYRGDPEAVHLGASKN